MSERILVVGTVGVSLPPPYAGIPKLTLLVARLWREKGAAVAVSFVEKRTPADDLGAGAEYFFEFSSENPTKFDKLVFLFKYFFCNPILYFKLFFLYHHADPVITREVFLYSAYGVFVDQIVQNFKPTVIVCEAALIKGFMAMQVGNLRGTPVVIDTYAEVHDDSMWVNKRMSESEREIFWKYFLNRAALIIAPSYYCAKGPLKYLAKENVKVVYPGIDIALSNSQEIGTQKSAREYFKLPQEPFFVTAVGAFSLRKGHDHLIRAVAEARRAGHAISLTLCGPGPQEQWRELARTENISEHVYFFTALSELELYRLYRACDLYCDASNTPRACLGMSLTEAALMELPVVAYDAGGLPEVVREGETGFLVPLNDVSALSRALIRASEMPREDLHQFGVRGREWMLGLVDIELMAINKLSILTEVSKSFVKTSEK